MNKKLVSFCIPCYNEGENITEMYYNLQKEIAPLYEKYNFEIIFEDNASTDNTVDLLKALACHDKNVKVILNSRNFGAMKNGSYIMFQARGEAVIGFPCDLQVPLSLIKDYLNYWEEGYQVVMGQISSSKEHKGMFKIRSLYYKIMDSFSDIPQLYHVTGAGLFSKSALDLIQSLNEPEPNFRYLVTELGFKYKLIPYVQPVRKGGKSSYNFFSYYNQAVDSFTEVSRKPLRYITNLGVFLTIGSFLFTIGIIIFKCVNWNNFSLHYWLLFGIGFIICSLQILCIGFAGEYINIILKRSIERPMVVEKERINFYSNGVVNSTEGNNEKLV